MRFILLSIMAMMMQSAVAASNGPSLILSWERFSALKPAQRMEYLKDMREIVMMMEQAQGQYEVASNGSLDELKEYIASIEMMNAVLPSAEAQESTGPYWSDEEFDKNRIGWYCPDPMTVFDQKAGTCVYTRTWFKEAISTFPSADDCPAGSTAIKGSGANAGFMCIPSGSWKVMTPERQLALKSGKFLEYGALDGKDRSASIGILRGAQTASADDSPPGPAPVSPAAPAGAVTPTGPQAGGPATPGDEPGAVTPRPQQDKVAPPESKAEKNPEGKPIEAKSPNAPACEAPAFKCESMSKKQREKLIKEFRSNHKPGSNICVYGGFFSKYQTNQKKKGTCMPVRRFPEVGKNKVTCKDQKMIVCNPLLFCVGAPDDAGNVKPGRLCVPQSADATKRCNADFNKKLGGEPFPDQPGKTPVACDPSNVSLPKQFMTKEAWTEMANGLEQKFKTWCLGNDGFEALFCKECNTISQRLHAMNMKVRSEECAGTTSFDASPKPSEPGPPGKSDGAQ